MKCGQSRGERHQLDALDDSDRESNVISVYVFLIDIQAYRILVI